MIKVKHKSFREWFKNDYLMRVNLSSELINGNKTLSMRQERICVTAEKIIANPSISLEELRRKISIEFFITMRCALDYINYAKMLIDEWKESLVAKNVQ
jgi:hypothetical protein